MACFIVPLVQAAATSLYRKLNAKGISSPDASALRRNVP